MSRKLLLSLLALLSFGALAFGSLSDSDLQDIMNEIGD